MKNIGAVITTIGINKGKQLDKCLSGFNEFVTNNDDFHFDVVVIDDGWSGVTEEIVDKFANTQKMDIKHVESDMKHMGFARSVNEAVELLDTDAMDNMIIAHDDVEINKDTKIDILISAIESDPTIGVVAPKGLFPRGNTSSTFVEFKRTNDGQIEIEQPFVGWYKEYNLINVRAFVHAIKSGFWVTKCDFFKTIGGFDTQFAPCLFEDLDYCVNIRSVGGRVLYAPEVEVIHSTRTSISNETVNLEQVGSHNLQRFWEKWKNRIELLGGDSNQNKV